MSASRFPPKVLEYSAQIAERAYNKRTWESDWKLLVATIFSSKGSSELAKQLGLPDKVPPFDCTGPEDLDALLEKWDEKLQTIGEDAQLANVDMQNMLQKQQQTMQMMSQISEMLHDTAMSVIRNMGG